MMQVTVLGVGGGYYDRYLAPSSGPSDKQAPYVLGIAFACQRTAQLLPSADWDVGLDGVVTELGWQEFKE